MSVTVRFRSSGQDDFRDSQSDKESSRETNKYGKGSVKRFLDCKNKNIHELSTLFITEKLLTLYFRYNFHFIFSFISFSTKEIIGLQRKSCKMQNKVFSFVSVLNNCKVQYRIYEIKHASSLF